MKLTKKEQKELIENCIERNKRSLEAMKGCGDINSLQVIANIEGKIQAFNDVLEMLNNKPMMIKIEAGK